MKATTRAKAGHPIGRIFEVDFLLPAQRRKNHRHSGRGRATGDSTNRNAAKPTSRASKQISPEAAKEMAQLTLF